MKPVADNSLRQAAVFLRSLDTEAAAAMLGRLSPDEARALRAAVRELGEIDQDERHRVADRARTAGQGESDSARLADRVASADGAVELQLGSSAPALEAPPAPPASPAPRDGAAWLGSLDGADPKAIADYLAREQPRAIAAVLGYLSPELSAGVLQSLPSEERAAVVARLAHQGEADPDSLRVIAGGLADWLEQQRQEHDRRSQRVATIRQILAATPSAERPALLDSLAQSDPGIAASLAADFPPPAPAAPTPPPTRVKPQPPPALKIPFDQLSRLDPRALAEALGSLNARTALLALAAAPEELLSRITSGLTRTAAADLRKRIVRVGPTTLAEIDRSQDALAKAASRVVTTRQAGRAPLTSREA